MKISKLLVLSALWLIGLSANAAEDLIERTEPTNEKVKEVAVAFEVGKTYLLYNKTAEMYFTQGSTWSTRGCVAPNKLSAVRIKVAKYTVADAEWDGKTYEIQNYVTNRSSYSWYKACMNEAGDLYLDQSTWANRFYEIQDQGDNVYRLMPNDVNEAVKSDGTQFVGRDESIPYDSSNDSAGFEDAEERVPLTALLTEGEGHHIDWVFYDASCYDAYEKSKTLRALIETAEDEGIDVSAAVTVYNNEDATLEEIEAAIKALQEAMAGGIDQGTADNPTNATSLITNPNFDNASPAGWNGSTPNMVGSGAHGPANVPEFYQGSNIDMYQELSGMPTGVYRLDMYGFYRSGSISAAYDNFLSGENYRAKLYATVDDDMLTADVANPYEAQNTTPYAGDTSWGVRANEGSNNGFYIPDDPSCARVYFEKGWYNNTLFFYVSADNARIGVREDGSNISTDWFVFDTFSLHYYGNTAASFQKWVELSVPSFEDALVTASMLSNYQSTVSSLAGSASDKASAVAAVEQLKPLVAELKANQALWAQYQAKINEGLEIAHSAEFAAYAGDLADACEYDGEDHLSNLDLDNDGLKAEMARIDELIAEVRKQAAEDVKVDEEVTSRWLTNADFAKKGEGWTVSKGSCNFNNGIAEAYGVDFDIHQDHVDAKKGVYELQLQGFFRMERDDNAYNKYLAGDQKTDAGVYIGTDKSTNKTFLKCVFEEVIDYDNLSNKNGFWQEPNSGSWYANTMESANTAFQQGMYNNVAYGIVTNEGETLRIGVAGNVTGANWICWDNFRLFYRGYENANANKYLLEKELEAFAEIDMTREMGTSVRAAVEKAKADAQAAITSGDASQMFDALSELFAVKSKIDESVALFADLKSQLQDLKYEMNQSDNMEAVAEAGAVLEEINDGLTNGDYDDEDVPALLAKISAAMNKLYMPGDFMTATDANPQDGTKFIRSATYSEMDEEGNETNQDKGWLGDKGNTGNDDTQKAALLYEYWNKTFEHYQVLSLPKGAYELSVFGFNRYGGNPEDYEAMNNGTPNTAFLYTETGGLHRRVAMPFINSGAEQYGMSDDDAKLMFDASGNVTTNEEEASVVYYMPNSMVTARTYFDMGKYHSTITVVVPDENDGWGTLRFGIEKLENQENGWCILDDWNLTYFGPNSTKTATGEIVDAEGIETATVAKPMKVEYFTLDGRKATAAQKGIIIVRQTMDNGSVVVRKIQK